MRTSGSLKLFTQDIMTTANSRYGISAGCTPPIQHPFLPHSNCMGQVVLIIPVIQTKRQSPKTRHLPKFGRRKAQNGEENPNSPTQTWTSNTQPSAPTSHLSSHFYQASLQRLWQSAASRVSHFRLSMWSSLTLALGRFLSHPTERGLCRARFGQPRFRQVSHFTEEPFRRGEEMSCL